MVIEPVPGHAGLWNDHAISGNGKRVAFSSSGDPTGGNADGNHEIFVYDLEAKRMVQVTDTVAQPGWYSNTGVSINHSGDRVAFRSGFAVDGAGGDIPGRDRFVADLDFNASIPVTRIRRVTHSNVQGIAKLSANGTYLFFVSDSRVGGLNNAREVKLFRVLLDPHPTISIIDMYGGIADQRWEVDFDVGYDGLTVAFTSDRDLVTGQNPDGHRQVFLLRGSPATPSRTSSRWPSIHPAPGSATRG